MAMFTSYVSNSQTKVGTVPNFNQYSEAKQKHVWGAQADLVLLYLVFSKNQPESVLKVFLKLFLKV